MHIKQIELYGFKSFVDKTVISLSTGICAVVGPNGCGKSNIVDAIRWVLGEQSARQLRGKLMEEVIFSGANGRPSLNLAEVSLVLANEDGKAPPPYHDCSEIMVTRRLFRSGESEYLINKIPCRRMDITRLFLDTGIGHRHYAIIEQGKIGLVVESKPDDIRALIEEAAGITKFKLKKKAALRKIELTHQNLLRLGDIIAEVSRQISNLQHQARRANRYRTLKQEIKQLEIRRALHHYHDWLQDLQSLKENLRSLEDTQSKRAAQLGRLEAEIADRGSKSHQLEERLQRQRESLFQLRNTINSDENKLDHLQRQTKDLKDRRERLTEELKEQEERQEQRTAEKGRLAGEQLRLGEACAKAELLAGQANADLNLEKNRLNQLKDRVDGWKADLVDLLGEVARVRNQDLAARRRLEELSHRSARRGLELQELGKQRAGLQPQTKRLDSDTASVRGEIEALLVETDHLRRKHQDLEQLHKELGETIGARESSYRQQESQLQVLREMERSYGWFSDAVKALMNAREKGELQCTIRGVVAEMLEVEASHRQAVEAALGDRLQALVVESPADACSALDHLKRTSAGRNYFIPYTIARSRPEPVTTDNGPVPLAVLVKPHLGYEPIVHFLLDRVLYCTDLNQALAWWQAHPHTHTLVTAEGDLVARDGALWGGSRDQQISILEKQEERKGLEKKVAELECSLRAEQRRLKESEEELAQMISRLKTIETKQQQLRERLLEKEKEHYRLRNEEQKILDRLTMLNTEKEQDEEEAALLEIERSESQKELEDLERGQQELASEIAEAQNERQELEARVESLQEQATVRQVSLGTLMEKRESVGSELRRLVEYHSEGEGRLRQIREEVEFCRKQFESLAGEERQGRDRLERSHRVLLEEETRLKAEEDRWREFEARQQELEAQRLHLLQDDKKQQQEIQRLHQETTELNLKLQYLIHQIQERYRLDLTTEEVPDQEKPFDLAKVEEKLQRLRDQVARIGEVNLTAIQEYEEQKQRHDFLIAQRDDLVQSLEGLKKAISRINRTTRSRFLRTLEAVNRKLTEVFPMLFNGGSGRLQLLDDRDPLESGVEILVHPPGKRLTSMSLLSGGEKALAAVALLFSLYMIRPSPFCILDEVDSPLDDANIDRFNQVLRRISQDSQIIMVTHNKRSMEISDVLLGVTMEEPGISAIISVNFRGVPDAHGKLV